MLARTQPRRLASDAGFDALTHSMEAYVSVYANDFTDGMALHACKLIWDNLAESVNSEPGETKKKAQEKMHNAATMAGMAFGSAFLGMCHAMAHTIGALCHIAHGRTNSILLPYVIRYNGQVPGGADLLAEVQQVHRAGALPGARLAARGRPRQDPGRGCRESGEGRRGLPRQ